MFYVGKSSRIGRWWQLCGDLFHHDVCVSDLGLHLSLKLFLQDLVLSTKGSELE